MDRRVKERLVGATILVVLLVLIVPELLSGPKGPPPAPPSPTGAPAEAMRNVTVDLATDKATPPAAASSIPDAPAAAPPAGADGAAASPEAPSAAAAPPTISTLKAQPPDSAPVESGATPPMMSSAPASKPPPATGERAVGAAESAVGAAAAVGSGNAARHDWAVQLGSFASRANADKLVHLLKGAHEAGAYVSSIGRGPALRYRVRIGPLPDRAAAERLRARLAREGHPASLVAS